MMMKMKMETKARFQDYDILICFTYKQLIPFLFLCNA